MTYVSSNPRITAALDAAHGWLPLLNAVPGVVLLLDDGLRIAYTTSPIRTGPPSTTSPMSVIGRHVLEFVEPEQQDLIRTSIESVFATGNPSSYEVLAGAAAGIGDRWYLSNVGPVFDEQGVVILVAIISTDITERREMELARERALEAEREAAARLREIDELKNEFVAKVVHDLRTPVTVIRGFAETLDNRWDSIPDHDKRGYLGHMVAGSVRLQRLVEDVMRVAQLEAGELRFEVDEFDLRALVRDTIAEFQAIAGGDRIRFIDATDSNATGVGDSLRYRQVITNLLVNALRYSPEASGIDVTVDAVSNVLWRVAVTDRGVGITAEDQARLFQRFTQLDDAGRSDGTGLGLYICRSIVEAQGGTIGVESVVGQGSTFSFTVPTIAGAPPAAR